MPTDNASVPTDPVRDQALTILSAVEAGTFLDRALEDLPPVFGTGSPERARLHYLTAGVTRFRLRLDTELDHHLARGLESVPPLVRQILRLALFEVRFADTPAWAAVNAAVDLVRQTKFAGLSGLVNAVLRTAQRSGEPPLPAEPRERLPIETSHPPWLLDEIAAFFGTEAAEAYAAWNNDPAPLWARVNQAVTGVEAERAALLEAGLESVEEGVLPGWIRCEPGTIAPLLPALEAGRLRVQDPSAGLAVLAAGEVAGLRIADLCAAPGGKGSHLAERGGGRAAVTVTDADPDRYRRLEQVVQTHGSLGLERREYAAVMAETGRFDLVLLDVPCSNTGVLRRRADARWRLGPDTAGEMAGVQLALLAEGGELLRPGGVLIYSTCSVLPAENEEVVERFLSHHTAFIPDELPPSFPAGFVSGPGRAASLPWKHGLDGAFTARLKRAGT